jgi:thiamine-phosphate pyrophosphorylase
VTLCLVTDRHRLSPGERSLAAARRCLLEQTRYAVVAGVDLIHLRERDLAAADLAALAVELLAITRGSGTRVVINDRIDVAIACGADGVHLRADSINVAAARRLAPRPFLIGRSVHNASEAAGAAGADYVVAGTVFPSLSKPGLDGGGTQDDFHGQGLLGTGGLKAVVQAASVPVLAIGGVSVERAGEVARAGASGIAAIGLFMRTGPEKAGATAAPPCCAVPLRDIADALRRTFDSSRPAP